MSFGRQVRALMRKNCILKRRQKCGTLGEFLTPFLFCLILCLLAFNNAFRYLASDPSIRSKDLFRYLINPLDVLIILVQV